MTDTEYPMAGCMPVVVQRRGHPEVRAMMIISLKDDASGLLDAGWEFPRVLLKPSDYGAQVAGPLTGRMT